jgi:hypothetical protein
MTDEKNDSKVVNPHDKVFRQVYSDKENARSLLADKLPDKVLKLVYLGSILGMGLSKPFCGKAPF